MLRIRRDLVDAMTAHAHAELPLEACGVIAGPAGGDTPQRLIPMVNAARSPTFYEVDPADLLSLHREMEARGERPVVIYHSHPSGEAYPSATDVRLAAEPDAHYVLIAPLQQGGPQVRSYRIVASKVTEEEVEIEDFVP